MNSKPRRCANCFQPISRWRLQVLPDTRTCTDCSRVVKVTDEDVDCGGAAPEEIVGSAIGDWGDR